MELRRAVCFCLLTLAACGGDQASEAEPADGDDAAVVDTADSSALSPAVGDGGVGTTDGSTIGVVLASPVADAAIWSVTDGELPKAECDHGQLADADGDGYFVILRASTCPGDGAPSTLDCYDNNKDARPGQTGRFAVDRGDGSFDYNCDGNETGIYTNVAMCPDMSHVTCPPPNYQDPSATCDYEAAIAPYRAAHDGWADSVPACGVSACFGLGLSWNNTTKTYHCAPEDGMPCNDMTQLCN